MRTTHSDGVIMCVIAVIRCGVSSDVMCGVGCEGIVGLRSVGVVCSVMLACNFW